MGPKPAAGDPNEIKYIRMKVVGGEIAAAAALAPKCAPCGLPPKKVGEDIQKATLPWKGIKIYVEIAVQNRQCTVSILPTAAPLIIKALGEPLRDRKKTKNVKHDGKLKMDDIVAIAKQMKGRSMSASFQGIVKEILGTCVSVGCTIDGKDPRDVQAAIDAGEIKVHA